MLHAANNLISLGRGIGLRVTLITQRPAKLHKDSLTQVETLIALRLIAPQDRRAVEDWIGEWADPKEGKELLASLPSLPTGTGWIWAPEIGVLKKAAFPKIKTYDSGRAPADTEESGPVLAAIDLPAIQEKLGAVAAEAKANDPKALKAEVALLKKQLAKQGPASDTAALAEVEHRGYTRGKIEGYADAMKLAELFLPKLRQIAATASELSHGIEQWAARKPQPSQRPVASVRPPETPRPSGNPGSDEVGQGGLRRIMVALAQCPNGLSTRQIGVRAALSSKSGTFSTYMSRARSNGWVEGSGDRIKITQAGLDALGNYEPCLSA